MFARWFGFKSGVAIYTRPEPIVSAPVDAIPAVVRATQLISADIARLPISVLDSDGQTIPDHPVSMLMNREASRWQSGYEFRRYTTSVALTHGNGLALIRRSSDGAIAELQPIPADAMSGEVTDDGVIYRIGSTVLNQDQILHVGCYPDHLNPCWFRSPLEMARHAMQLAADEDGAHAALVKTGSMGKIAISHPGAMSDQTVQAIRDAWMTMHATADGASRPLILREGMKAEKISQETSSSMLESRRFSVQEIARAFGVPPEMLFQQGGGALSSQAETARAYADGAIAAWASAWESELQRKLCAPGERVHIDTTPITRGNLRDQGMAFSKLVLAGIMSPNDARHYLGLPPIDGLDTPTVSMPGGASGAVVDGNPDAEGDNA
ncbi:MAG: phage portal protein [Hyphomicrobiaceae bacterium]